VILIKNGLLIDPANGKEGEFDLLIDSGRVKDVQVRGGFDGIEVERTLDAQNKWVTPGLIDLHVHLRDPGFEWKETIRTGCEAAALGGFTSICSMPNTNPRNDSAEITKYILEKAREAGVARVLPIGAVSRQLLGKQMAPLSELQDAGCVAFSDDGEPIYDAGLMRRALEWCSMTGATISCHEEDKCLSCGGSMNESALSFRMGLGGMAKVAEEVMIARDIELARTTGGKVHICHISSGRGVELVRRAKNDGIPITAEVTPHHLILSEEEVEGYNTNAKMSPPLREDWEIEELLRGLKDGTLDAVASDHAPHEQDSKLVEFSRASFGILGLQTSLPLILKLVKNGSLSRSRAIEVLTSSPASVFGLELGTLRKGALADVIIVDPEREWTFSKEQIKSLSFNSPFIGWDLQGIAETVLLGGKIVVEAGELCK